MRILRHSYIRFVTYTGTTNWHLIANFYRTYGSYLESSAEKSLEFSSYLFCRLRSLTYVIVSEKIVAFWESLIIQGRLSHALESWIDLSCSENQGYNDIKHYFAYMSSPKVRIRLYRTKIHNGYMNSTKNRVQIGPSNDLNRFHNTLNIVSPMFEVIWYWKVEPDGPSNTYCMQYKTHQDL